MRDKELLSERTRQWKNVRESTVDAKPQSHPSRSFPPETRLCSIGPVFIEGYEEVYEYKGR